MTRRRKSEDTLALNIPRRHGPYAWLIIAPDTPGERRVQIDRRPVLIGADPSVDVVLEDLTVSRRHCEIRATGAGFRISDLGSLNGTHVDGISVGQAQLKNGVVITLGQTQLRFETGGNCESVDHSPAGQKEVPTSFGAAVGSAPAMREMFALLGRLAPAELTITLTGETGTGKDVLARAIHDNSPRRDKPFVTFDAGAVPPTLIEGELFGYQRGAFTGAVSDKRGRFETADGGTLFLDEIGELNLELQPKLLRALEQRTISRLGDERERPIDVRIIAATNRNLEKEVQEGRFRQDLYFRLSAAVVAVPPLRDRREDIPALLAAFNAEMNSRVTLSKEALLILQTYDWPGNIRELKNVIASAAAVAGKSELEARDFLRLDRKRSRTSTLDGLALAGRSLASIEAAAIQQTLRQFGGNKSRAAKSLGIAASTLYEKIKKYNLHT